MVGRRRLIPDTPVERGSLAMGLDPRTRHMTWPWVQRTARNTGLRIMTADSYAAWSAAEAAKRRNGSGWAVHDSHELSAEQNSLPPSAWHTDADVATHVCVASST